RAHAYRAGVRVRNDALRRHEPSAGPRRGRPRRHSAVGPREIAFPEPSADPPDPRPVDRQVHGTPSVGARRSQNHAGGNAMTNATQTTWYAHPVYINARGKKVWDAITDPAWNGRYGYHAPSHYDLRPGGLYSVRSTDEMQAQGAPEVLIDGEVIECDPPTRL